MKKHGRGVKGKDGRAREEVVKEEREVEKQEERGG